MTVVSFLPAVRLPVCRSADDPQSVPYIDLQWFAAEDEGRTEEASEQKKRKAREEGRVAKSQDFNSAICLFFTSLALIMLAPWIFNQCVEIVQAYLLRCTEPDLGGMNLYVMFLTHFVKLFLPVAAVTMVFGISANIVQNGGMLITTKTIEPKLSKILPKFGQFFKRIFGAEGMVKLVLSLVKIIFIGVVAYLMIRSELQKFQGLIQTSLWTGFSFIAGIAGRLLLTVSIMLIVLSVPDYLFQRHQYRESLKMTKQEVKEEIKQDMGDPLVRSRLRQRMQEILSQSIAVAVPKADVVITNPTHFAVAVEYDADTMPNGPVIVAKGADETAQRIKAIARDHNVAVIENRPLARALYANVEVGDVIPSEYYRMVVGVFQFVLKLDASKAKKWGYSI